MRKREALSTFIISFSDGLILPIVIIAVLSHIADGFYLLPIALPIIALYAIVMGFSIYLTKRSHGNTAIKTETFKNIGLSKDLEEQLLQDHEQEKQEWEEVLKENEFAEKKNREGALISTVAYFFSGIIVLLPFSSPFIDDAFKFKLSCIICAVLIVVFGILKARATGNAVFRVVLRNLFYAATLVAMIYWLGEMLTTPAPAV